MNGIGGALEGIEIRAAEPSDAEALVALANMPGYRFGTLRLPFESVEAGRRRLFPGNPDLHSLVAVMDGRIVGSAGLARQGGRRSHVGQIGMGVHDDWTGRGVGRLLMETVLDLADNWLGLLRLELSVNVDNERALRLYERCGFEIEGRERRSILRAGSYVDAFTMARLREAPETLRNETPQA